VTILPEPYYNWFVISGMVGISAGWALVDIVRLRGQLRVYRTGNQSSEARDQIFGSVIGIVLGTLGLVGLFKYYLHL
jgi:hypothetical protein